MNTLAILKKAMLILAILPLLSLANLYTSNSLVAERFDRGGEGFHNEGFHNQNFHNEGNRYNTQRGYNNQYDRNSYNRGYDTGAYRGYEAGQNNNMGYPVESPTYVLPVDPGSYESLNPQQQ